VEDTVPINIVPIDAEGKKGTPSTNRMPTTQKLKKFLAPIKGVVKIMEGYYLTL